ncbi:MAG: trehalose-6-phosphate synthase [Pseudomonadota bacterium]
MSRLVVVSNRVADLSKASQSGGLAVALADALGERGGLWFGWDGKVVARGTRVPATVKNEGAVTTVTLPLTRKDYQDYYLDFSNSVLWPIFHYRLDLAEFSKVALNGYKRVNSKFADALAPLLKPDDLIWVQDYHLIPLAQELRKRGFRQKIGFFLHIPFPPPDILEAAPDHRWLLRAFSSYDVVGVQTEADLVNFQRANAMAGRRSELAKRWRGTEGQPFAAAFPIGIDVDAFATLARTPEADAHIEHLQRRLIARTHIIGVDRLDYSKGLPDRLRAFEVFLKTHPELHKSVTLMQIASPTRESVEAYTEIRQELEALAGAINGVYGDFDWTPLRYINRAVARDTLAALFRGSQVGLVTPLRDGMNLVAKEYIAAQDQDDPGVLILSRFAGAAEELTEAIQVNPYDIDEVAEAISKATKMSLEERRDRNAALLARIRHHDAKNWCRTFLDVLAQ